MILLRYVTHYRAPFLEQLRDELARRGIELVLIHGAVEPEGSADRRQHSIEIPWALRIENRWLHLAGKRLLWQPALPLLRRGDLVIVDQASSRVLNYLLFAAHLLGRYRLAFWGHGRNFQEHRASRVGEAVKRIMSRHVHWWFAYNRRSVEVLRDIGYPDARITDVQNAIDTGALAAARDALPDEAIAAVRAELGITGRHVGAYVGGMYAAKRLPFLVEACDLVRERVPDFEMLLIGDGTHAHVVEEATQTRPWLHALGPKTGTDRVPYLAAAQLLLMPGLVGLAVLDAFALRLPLVTTGDVAHSVEIAYLEDGVNGLVVAGAPVTPADYAGAVAALFEDAERLGGLVEGCRAASDRYTLESMVQRFADGVEAAVQQAGRADPARPR